MAYCGASSSVTLIEELSSLRIGFARASILLAFYYIYIFPVILQLGEISVYTTTTELKMSQQLRFLSPRTFSRLHHRFAFISLPAFAPSVPHSRTEVRFQSKFQSINVVAASSDNVDPQKLQVSLPFLLSNPSLLTEDFEELLQFCSWL